MSEAIGNLEEVLVALYINIVILAPVSNYDLTLTWRRPSPHPGMLGEDFLTTLLELLPKRVFLKTRAQVCCVLRRRKLTGCD